MRIRFLMLSLSALWLSACSLYAGAEQRRPNVVLIMTDNHGAWTLGCYGNEDIRTPHIDRLAREGIRFTRAFASNPVCSPTRATYLTGLLPSQHGVHCYLRAGEAQIGNDAYSTIAEFRTLPEILNDAGYRCGLVGKWHLGDNLNPQEGFEDQWITMPHGATSTFYDAPIIRAGRVEKEPQYLTEFWTAEGVQFIEEHRKEPFFLFLSYNGPYSLGGLLDRPARNRHAEYYADKLLPSFPREQIHPWLFSNRKYLNNVGSIRRVAAEISAIDDGVGAVLEALQRLELDDETLVILAADQGWAGGQHGLWGMGDHTRPLSAFDPAMHIPLIYRHTGHIPAGCTSELMTSNYDFFTTVLSYLQLKADAPADPRSPGRDYTPVLLGTTTQPKGWTDIVFYEAENLRAVRTPQWKYVERFPDGPHELYDLAADPGEQFNLYGQPLQAAVQKGLQGTLHTFFAEYATPEYDLLRGGRSKPKLIVSGSHRLE